VSVIAMSFALTFRAVVLTAVPFVGDFLKEVNPKRRLLSNQKPRKCAQNARAGTKKITNESPQIALT
jgi:hypothetical protein